MQFYLLNLLMILFNILQVDHRSFSPELETCIHYLKPGEEHTVQIISKLSSKFCFYYDNDFVALFYKDGKEKHRSDLIRFTVPAENDAPMSEVLNVCDQRVPSKLLGLIFCSFISVLYCLQLILRLKKKKKSLHCQIFINIKNVFQNCFKNFTIKLKKEKLIKTYTTYFY